MPSLLEVPLRKADGSLAKLNDYQGQVVLIVNTASQCGFTPQYAELEALYNEYKDRGFTVIAFPSNDFAGQEPGTDAEIAQFCSTNYNVTFPVFAKTIVSGPNKSPLYAALIAAKPTRTAHDDSLFQHLAGFAAEHGFSKPNAAPEVLLNFEKFLLDRDGNVAARFNSDITVNDPHFRAAFAAALAQERSVTDYPEK